jgi:hypothetical protein
MALQTRVGALAVVLACGSAGWSQVSPGTIQGTVLSADRRPIPRATVYYGRSGRSKGNAAASVLPPVLTLKAGLDGTFTLPNLSPGGWTVCIEARGYVNPCHWSAAPSFNVTAGHTVANADIRLDEAYTLQIRINDPHGFLANEGKSPGGPLRIGVHAPSGAFQHAMLWRADTKGRDYSVVIPLKSAAKLFVSGGAFQLNDDAGVALSKNGKLTQLLAPDSSKVAAGEILPLQFTVTGLGKP